MYFDLTSTLGKWNIKDLADEHNTAGFPSGLLEWLLGSCISKEAAETFSEGTIDLNGVALMKRDEDEYNVKLSDWTGWGDDETLENKLDVCHLVDVWSKTEDDEMFFWRPLGEQFPGLDSVFKEGSSNLYFITHVKTGKAVDEFDSGWIEKAVRISI